MDVDRAVHDLGLVLAVDGIEQLIARQDSTIGLQQRLEEPELDARQVDRRACAEDVEAIEVHDEVGVGQRPAPVRAARRTAAGPVRRRPPGRRASAGPAQDRLHPQDELGRRERLRQVVVGAVLEARDPVERRAAGADDEDRRRGRLVVAAHGPDDGPAVQFGEHQVQHDQRRPMAFDGVEGAGSVGRGHDAEAVALEVRSHQPDDLRVVVDDEDRPLRDGVGDGLGMASMVGERLGAA